MRLLVVTQTIDKNDPVLGFFHRWVEELSKRCAQVEVICLKKGEYSLPSNVSVHSLGKEIGGSRFLYTLRFLRLAVSLNARIDTVFVHMNPEYVVLMGWWWRLVGKRIALWYNHEIASPSFALTCGLVHRVFHTSPFAASARARNAKQMPAGIDTNLFSEQEVARVPRSVYFQGRITEAKRIHILLSALRLVRAEGTSATLTLVGPQDALYLEQLQEEYKDLFEAGAVHVKGPVAHHETPQLYGAHWVSVNLTAAGNFDKTVLESGACKTPVIVGSPAFKEVVPSEWTIDGTDAAALSRALTRAFALSEAEHHALGQELRERVIATHSLSRLMDQLYSELVGARIL